MDAPASTPDFEACPSCSQRTAPQFFRSVGKQRLCVLCAQRTDRDAADTRAQIEDRRLHGGAGWLWKHIGYTAYATVGGVIVRQFILHYIYSR